MIVLQLGTRRLQTSWIPEQHSYRNHSGWVWRAALKGYIQFRKVIIDGADSQGWAQPCASIQSPCFAPLPRYGLPFLQQPESSSLVMSLWTPVPAECHNRGPPIRKLAHHQTHCLNLTSFFPASLWKLTTDPPQLGQAARPSSPGGLAQLPPRSSTCISTAFLPLIHSLTGKTQFFYFFTLSANTRVVWTLPQTVFTSAAVPHR